MAFESKAPAIVCAAVIAAAVAGLGTFALTRSDTASAQPAQSVNGNGPRATPANGDRNQPIRPGELIQTSDWQPERVKVVHIYKPAYVQKTVYKYIRRYCW